MNLPLYLAYKYLTFKQKDRSVVFMMRICFFGILIGTFSLMLTLIIMNGFEKVIHEKMQGISSQAIIYSPGEKIDAENIKTFLNKKFPSDIKAMSASIIKQVIIDQSNKQHVLFIKGVEPKHEHEVSSIADKIILPHSISRESSALHSGQSASSKPPQSLVKLLQNDQIIIGYKTAKQLNLKIGSTINLLIPEPGSKRKIFLEKKTATVVGIFNVGLDEYDSNFAYGSIDFVKKLFNEKKGADQLALNFTDKHRNEEKIIKSLRKNMPGLTISSWKELYPALVSSLKLEKFVMFFILILITLVASMNMISLLFMQIQQKRRDVAIFKAMGMSVKNIKSIFLYIGMTITFLASTLGLGLAALVGFMLQKYPFIQLPDVYYVSYLPARMDLEIFIVVFVATLLLGFLATIIPARKAKRINVAQVLRQE